MNRWKQAAQEYKKLTYKQALIRVIAAFAYAMVVLLIIKTSLLYKLGMAALLLVLVVGAGFLRVRFSNENIPVFEETPDLMKLHWMIYGVFGAVILMISGVVYIIVN